MTDSSRPRPSRSPSELEADHGSLWKNSGRSSIEVCKYVPHQVERGFEHRVGGEKVAYEKHALVSKSGTEHIMTYPDSRWSIQVRAASLPPHYASKRTFDEDIYWYSCHCKQASQSIRVDRGFRWGWSDLRKLNTFHTPELVIENGSVRTDNTFKRATDDDRILSSYRLPVPDEHSLRAGFPALLDALLVHNPHETLPILLNAFFAPFRPFLSLLHEEYPFWLFVTGPTGTGKTEAAKLFNNLYGDFGSTGSVLSFRSTPNSIWPCLSSLPGASAIVDDLKSEHVSPNEHLAQLRLLQAIQGLGRSRMNGRDGTIKHESPIHCAPVVTAERPPDEDPAIIARSIICPLSPHDLFSSSPTFREALTRRGDFPHVGTSWIAYLSQLKSTDRHRINKTYETEITRLESLADSFRPGIRQREAANAIRIVRNLAAYSVTLLEIERFAKGHCYSLMTEATARSIWKTWDDRSLPLLMGTTIDFISELSPKNLLIDEIEGALLSGSAYLRCVSGAEHLGARLPADPNTGSVCIGSVYHLSPGSSYAKESGVRIQLKDGSKHYGIALHSGTTKALKGQPVWSKIVRELNNHGALVDTTKQVLTDDPEGRSTRMRSKPLVRGVTMRLLTVLGLSPATTE